MLPATTLGRRPWLGAAWVRAMAASMPRKLSCRWQSDITGCEAEGLEPTYTAKAAGASVYTLQQPLHCELGSVLQGVSVAYETWGTLNATKDNAVVVFPALSASSHAASNEKDPSEGWWERFVGPGKAVDTTKFFVVCANSLGSCFGTTGPSSADPETGKPYALTFPMVTINDMVHATYHLLDKLGIEVPFAVVGSSLGGMQSLAAAALYPDRVQRMVTISAAARAHPSSIALRYAQRTVMMRDPKWNNGNYYESGAFPVDGLKNARMIAAIVYRSTPEWEAQFGQQRASPYAPHSFQADFRIEQYLEHQVEIHAKGLDPNSMLYLTKAMDIFDMGKGFDCLEDGLARIRAPTLVLGVQSDMAIPCWNQKKIAATLKAAGHPAVTFYELKSPYGHDTFMLDVRSMGAAIKGHLEH